MKQKSRVEEDDDVFAFRDEDCPKEPVNWSKKLRTKFPNPNSDDDAFKYQILEKYSSGFDAQIKEVPTVTLDDDDDADADEYSTDGSSAASLDSPHKAGCDALKSFSLMTDRASEQRATVTDSSFKHKLSTPLGHLSGNGHVSPMMPELPSCKDSVDLRDLDGGDMVQESSLLNFDSDLEENNDPTVGQGHDEPVAVSVLSEKDLRESVVIHADYVKYGDKYFPASVILISRDSVRLKTSAFEGDYTSTSEWRVDDILKIETQPSSLVDLATVRIRLLTKDAAHAEIANGTSSVEVVEFVVPNWSEQQERIMSLDVRYNAVLSMGLNLKSCDGDAVPLEDVECSSDPYIPDFQEPFEEVIYPKGEIDAVSVRKSDVDLLQPDVFLNDTIIDFYITFLKNEIPCDRRHASHFFSSFFFRKLADLDKNPSSISDGKAAFQRVRRWTRKVNIFEKDFIFIPVNYNLHWSLIVLCHPGEVANFNDENIDEALKVPCILHMDSIRGSHSGLKDLFQSYLLEEWKERQKETSEDISLKFFNLRFLSLELPQQENCSDCGLFLLHYAERFIREAPQNFRPSLINKFDNFLKPDWFMPGEASLKRVYIQRLIYELLKSRSHECVSPAGNSVSHSQAYPENNECDNGIEIVSEKRNPEKSWNGSSFDSEPVEDIDIGLLNMQLYRPLDCVDNSGLGMTQLLERQHYDRGQLQFPMPSIREVEGDGDLARTNMGRSGLQAIGRVGECHLGSMSGDFDQGFPWNSALSDQEEPECEDTSSSDTGYCSDSAEDTRILDCSGGIQSDDSCQNENVSQSKELFDTQEGYASASSDMMETPAEDSQELAEKYGDHNQKDPLDSNLVEAVEVFQEGLGSTEDERAVIEFDEELIVEDGKPVIGEIVAGADEKYEDHDQEDPLGSNLVEAVEASQEGLGSTEDERAVIEFDEELIVEDGKPVNDEIFAGADEKFGDHDQEDPHGSNLVEVVEASQEELGNIEEDERAVSGFDEELIVEDGKPGDDEMVEGADENLVVQDSPPDQLRPTKRLKLTPSRGDERQLI